MLHDLGSDGSQSDDNQSIYYARWDGPADRYPRSSNRRLRRFTGSPQPSIRLPTDHLVDGGENGEVYFSWPTPPWQPVGVSVPGASMPRPVGGGGRLYIHPMAPPTPSRSTNRAGCTWCGPLITVSPGARQPGADGFVGEIVGPPSRPKRRRPAAYLWQRLPSWRPEHTHYTSSSDGGAPGRFRLR
jgi:hypothetical protein